MLHRNSVQPGTPAHAAGHVTDHGSCRPDTMFLPALGGQGYRGRPPYQCCTRMCSTDFCIRQGWALISPVRGCGKTTLLILLEVLVAEGNRTDNITAAAIYYHLDRRPRTTLLVDEGDNLNLFDNATLRSLFNSGHRRGGAFGRFAGGWSRRFSTFAPLAIAAIGMRPLPLMRRAVVIRAIHESW
jgi:hypothetical protein